MRNLFTSLAILAASLLMSSQVTRPQQPSGEVSSGKADGEKCQKVIVVNGAVRAPSSFEIPDDAHLREILAMVGGVTERAGTTVQITHSALDLGCAEAARVGSDKPVERTQVYDLKDVRNGKANPLLLPGDVVTVSGEATIYVTGRVATPQAIKAPATITQAVAAAGGVLPDGSIDRVKIYRRLDGTSGDLMLIVVNLKSIKKKQAEDLALQPYDIVEVPCKGYRGGNCGPALTGPDPPMRIIY